LTGTVLKLTLLTNNKTIKTGEIMNRLKNYVEQKTKQGIKLKTVLDTLGLTYSQYGINKVKDNQDLKVGLIILINKLEENEKKIRELY